MAKTVTVVVINWNGRKFLKGCLSTLMKQTYRDFDVILVDNGSTDGSVEFVKKRYSKIRVIETGSNLGVAAATNIGFRAAKGKYIASLHNDAVPDMNWLKSLVDAIKSSPKNVACIEGSVEHFGGVGVLNGSLNILSYNILDVFDDPRKKFYSGTCSMIIKHGVMDEYCDSDYFFYQEDVKMGWMLRLMGYDIKREPASKVMHHGTVSASNMRIKRYFQFLSERNRLLNIFTLFESNTILKIMPIICFNIMFNSAKNITRSRWKLKPHIAAYLWVIAHPGFVMRKRCIAQDKRRIRDSEITPMLSSKLVADGSSLRNLNRLSLAYCRIMGIRTLEG